MTVLVFGSINIDHVYQVDQIVRPGETIPSRSYRQFQGGKGANQSIALARAGASVAHAGRIGQDGLWLRQELAQEGIDVTWVEVGDAPTGHALIQVERTGENAIVLYGGANRSIAAEQVYRVLGHFGPGDWLLVQNGIEWPPLYILEQARQRGVAIAFNPAPLTGDLLDLPLQAISLFVVNETEGVGLTAGGSPEEILTEMRRRYPRAATVLTLGATGAIYSDGAGEFHIPAQPVVAVDTTAAGDTFIGYLLAGLLEKQAPRRAVELATRAAALCVTRTGAAPSIPYRRELSAATQ